MPGHGPLRFAQGDGLSDLYSCACAIPVPEASRCVFVSVCTFALSPADAAVLSASPILLCRTFQLSPWRRRSASRDRSTAFRCASEASSFRCRSDSATSRSSASRCSCADAPFSALSPRGAVVVRRRRRVGLVQYSDAPLDFDESQTHLSQRDGSSTALQCHSGSARSLVGASVRWPGRYGLEGSELRPDIVRLRPR
jgi:hypothetical protein